MLMILESNRDSHPMLIGEQSDSLLWKTAWCFLQDETFAFHMSPAIMLLGTYPDRFKTCDHMKTCT
jgi:hypothetical protein